MDLPCFPSFTEILVDVLHRCEGKQKRDVKLTCVSVFFLPLSLCLVSVSVQGFNKDAVREIALLQELSRHPNIVTLREVVLQPDVRSPICTQGREGDAFGAILVTQIPSLECFGAAIPPSALSSLDLSATPPRRILLCARGLTDGPLSESFRGTSHNEGCAWCLIGQNMSFVTF